MAENPNRIAIIGGGVSGLAVAYHLITIEEPRIKDLEVVVYERGKTLGGNADTVKVVLGQNYAEKGCPDFKRWADQGVNDFNKASYEKMVDAMKRIRFGEDRYKPLEDTVCFFTLDGSVLYTVDKNLKPKTFTALREGERRIVDKRFHMRDALRDANDEFMKKAAEDIIEDRDRDQKLYRDMTVEAYVANYIKTEKKDASLIKEMAENILYPRIAAMYFVDERGPQTMPIVAVMEYYILQEGFPDVDKAKRMYFDRGSQSWINYLANWLENPKVRESDDRNLPKVKICKDFAARVRVSEDGVEVTRIGDGGGNSSQDDCACPADFGKVVFACHADDALRCFGPEGLTEEIATILGKVSYSNSVAICHTYTGVLPPNRDSWRTYNVLIRKGAATTPYSMTYLINRHQNDAMNPEYQEAGLPQYFVTLNPVVRIPDEFVLPIPPDFAERRAALAPGYPKTWPTQIDMAPGGDQPDPHKPITWFKHNVLDFDCLEAQEMLKTYHNNDPGAVYFSGGWTKGAGLHEQCWEQGEFVVKKMYPPENRMEPSPS